MADVAYPPGCESSLSFPPFFVVALCMKDEINTLLVRKNQFQPVYVFKMVISCSTASNMFLDPGLPAAVWDSVMPKMQYQSYQ